jgi:hypothetical protein
MACYKLRKENLIPSLVERLLNLSADLNQQGKDENAQVVKDAAKLITSLRRKVTYIERALKAKASEKKRNK